MIKLTVWHTDFNRVGPGILSIAGHRYIPTWREWLKTAIYHLCHLLDAAVFFITLGVITSSFASTWLFSEYLEEE